MQAFEHSMLTLVLIRFGGQNVMGLCHKRLSGVKTISKDGVTTVVCQVVITQTGAFCIRAVQVGKHSDLQQ